jgi:hypothetical protein
MSVFSPGFAGRPADNPQSTKGKRRAHGCVVARSLSE